jgi:ankyrin repeat protein
LPKLLAAVDVGDVAQVKQLVAAGEKIAQTFSGKTALSLAVTRCDQTMTEALLSLGAAINPNMDYDVAIKAIPCNNLKLVEMLAGLKGAYLDINESWKGYKTTSLGVAVANGQMELVKLLLAKGAKVDGWCRLGRCEGDWELSPLHVAAKTANVDMVRLLVNRGADTVVLDKNLLAPIIHLVMDKAGTEAQIVEIIKILAVRGLASVKYVSPRGPALAFIPDSWKETKQLLMSLGANQADVARFQREEAERWKKIAEEEEQARLAKEQAAKAASEAEERGVSISSDGRGGCTCTRRSQRWVSGSSGSGMVRGHSGHYEFYDEKVPCACQ